VLTMSRSGTISNFVLFGGRWAVKHKNQKHDTLRFTAHFAAVSNPNLERRRDGRVKTQTYKCPAVGQLVTSCCLVVAGP
jgi:hypothetical protein